MDIDWTQIILMALTVIGSVLGIFMTWFLKKMNTKYNLSEAKQEILAEMAVSVQTVYDEEVREAKLIAKTNGGKLSKEQKDRYKQKAIDYTKSGLSKYALRVFNAFAKEKVITLVEKAVNRSKGK